MERSSDVRAAILGLLRDLEAEDGRAIDLYDIGVPLIAQGFDQHAIANTLYALDRDGIIALIGSNRLQMRK